MLEIRCTDNHRIHVVPREKFIVVAVLRNFYTCLLLRIGIGLITAPVPQVRNGYKLKILSFCMVHEGGEERPSEPVGQHTDSPPYPVIGSDNLSATFHAYSPRGPTKNTRPH